MRQEAQYAPLVTAANNSARAELYGRLLPHAFETEQALLGSLMVSNGLYERVAPYVQSEHFAEDVHQLLFAAIGQMVTAGKVATPITMKAFLGDFDLGDGVTPMAYLARMAAEAALPANAVGYAKHIRDMAARRVFIRSCVEALHGAWDLGIDVSLEDLLREHEDRVEALRPRINGKQTGFRPIGAVAMEAYARVEGEWNGKIIRHTLTTGFEKLDRRIGGLEAPNLIIIAGRPAMGKTALAVTAAFNASLQIQREQNENPDTQAGVVGIITLEMSGHQLIERVLASNAQIRGTKIRGRKNLSNEDMHKLHREAEDLGRLPIEIDETGGQGIAQILARARKLHRQKRLRLLVIDYLQLIRGFRTRSGQVQRNIEIGEITNALKELAKELDIPVILLSQVGRQVETRDNKRPTMADLKESGDIEQDADNVLFVYREEAYVRLAEPLQGTQAHAEWEEALSRVEGLAEVIIGKNRFGGIGPILMGFDGPHTLFLEDPPERAADPEEVRRRAKKAVLPARSAILFEDMKGLFMHHSRTPTPEEFDRARQQGRPIHNKARIIDRAIVFKDFWDNRCPASSEKEAQTEFQKAMDPLRIAQKTKSFGAKEEGVWIWLPELVAE